MATQTVFGLYMTCGSDMQVLLDYLKQRVLCAGKYCSVFLQIENAQLKVT